MGIDSAKTERSATPSTSFSNSNITVACLTRIRSKPLFEIGLGAWSVIAKFHRAMLERPTAFEPSVVEGRFMIQVTYHNRPWIVIVEPDFDAQLLVVVTVYEVSE